jgi:hypothetical protein
MANSSALGFSFPIFDSVGFERKLRGRRGGPKETFFILAGLIRKFLSKTLNLFLQPVNLPLFLQTFGTGIDQRSVLPQPDDLFLDL